MVAAFSGEAALSRCLESLLPAAADIELIASTCLGHDILRRLQSRFPDVRLLGAPPGTDAFELRRRGLEVANGRLLLLTEDHCTLGPGWVDALCGAHDTGHSVMGGVVENGHAPSAYGRALYWCEYAAQMPPLPEAAHAVLSGVNVAYDRDALWSCRETWRASFYESEVHQALLDRGHDLWRVPNAVVVSHLGFRFGEALVHLYRGGRRFGSERRRRSSMSMAWVLRLSVCVVPLLLAARVVAAVLQRRPRDSGVLVLSLPYVASLCVAWGGGEAVGYWAIGRAR